MTEASKSDRLWFLNSHATILRSSDGGRDGPFIGEFHMPFGDSPPTHIHRDEEEIFHIVEGQIRFRVGEQEIVGRAGDTVVAPRGVPHSFRVESPQAHVINISTGGGFEGVLRGVGRPAETDGLPEVSPVTPELAKRLGEVGAANHVDIVGPPLSA